MKRRRRLLQTSIAIAAAGLAGCVNGGDGSPGDGDDGGPTDTAPSDGDSGSPGDGGDGGDGDGGSPTDTAQSDGGDGSPGDLETSFDVTRASCGNQVDQASVTFDDPEVSVEGTTWGNDACYLAYLESATMEGGTLTVAVITEKREADESCAQCIFEIEYRATVETPSTPDEVVVVHDGETVATATP